jgi:hypothetical protein
MKPAKSPPVDWIAKRIAEAQEAAPVEAAVGSRLEKQLNGAMHERTLTKSELAGLAKELIVATALPEPDHEN